MEGRPTSEDIAKFAASSASGEVYACGAEGFLDSFVEGVALWSPSAVVHLERFTTDPAKEENTAPDGGADIFGDPHKVDCGPDSTLLCALRSHGVESPYACEEGTCGACICRLVKGEVLLRYNDVLDADELAEGVHSRLPGGAGRR
ncbi:2Fe-2S iron-sulfur cluster binding domain-containing protein [Gordonia jinghuaiqii]|uniref:2Fe-2S iron-sulfur cluster binding domain-containing protein n=1 Tax=Gordonia jinghuaiqii TaxID=2758710 RepID=A0A7D7QZ94_9ACTN|nr:2Fe-2S iron-sulfur cluster binding domain-containing protein [Gordonia jinghuaiqii]